MNKNIDRQTLQNYKLNILLFDTYKTTTELLILAFIAEIVFTILTLTQNNFPFKEHIPLLISGNVMLIFIMCFAAKRGSRARIEMLLFEYWVLGMTEAKMELTSIMEKFGLTDEKIEEILNYDKDGTSTTKDTD